MTPEPPKIEVIEVEVGGKGRIDLHLDGESIARILIDWGAPMPAAAGAANQILEYVAARARAAGRPN